MTPPTLEEKTLLFPIANYLEKIGFSKVGEVKAGKRYANCLFRFNSSYLLVEVRVGTPEPGLKAIARVLTSLRELKTHNVLIISYPEKLRNQPGAEDSALTQREGVYALAQTDYLVEAFSNRPPGEILDMLKEYFRTEKVKVDFKAVVSQIEGYVEDLKSVIHDIETESLIPEVVYKLDLFQSIGEIKNRELAKRQIENLSAYLLLNQLLFCHIYQKITRKDVEYVGNLDEMRTVKEIQEYFRKIAHTNFKSMYRVNILGHVPDDPKIVQTLKDTIGAIALLRAEYITDDLAGRFFHDLLPFEVRKVLAAFYTHPIAAGILAGLTIESWNETVIDPACGSGTLLVSAYKRKQELYRILCGAIDSQKMHTQFIEEDITGFDRMPFAAHLTTINLTAQNREKETRAVRVGARDSLTLAPLLKKGFNGREMNTCTGIQKSVREISGHTVRKISQQEGGDEFPIKPVNVVIMNPPFSDRDKMPHNMREKLKNNKILGEICGNSINLWGYFLALADLLLVDHGKMGAVIPINIGRGKSTEKIRDYLLKNYHIKYIVKPVGDVAFSEGASFKDILLVAEKKKPKNNDITKIVFLKKSINSLSAQEVNTIVEMVSLDECDNEYLEMGSVTQSELVKNKDNLMLFFGGLSLKTMAVLRDFIEAVTEKSPLLSHLEGGSMKEGITSPQGLSQIVYVTNPTDETRVKKAFLIGKEKNNYLHAGIKNTPHVFEIPMMVVKPALRTLTGIKTLDISRTHDYIVCGPYENFESVQRYTKWKGTFDWDKVKEKIERLGYSRLVIPDKINVSSPNTSLLCCYSETPLVLSNLFFTYKILEESTCKILSLSLNSVLTLSQFMVFKSETLGSYIRLSADDWNLTFQIDPQKLSDEKRQKLLNLFNTLKIVEFPSITEQLEKRFWARVALDRNILEVLGFTGKEINEFLPRVYGVLVQELRAMKEIT